MKYDLNNTVFVSDLDGTLLNKKAELSERTIAALNDCISSGLRFTIATARTIESVKHIVKDVPLTLPMSLMNGVLLYDPMKRGYAKIHPIDSGEFVFIADKARTENVSAFAYTVEDSTALMTHYEDLPSPHMRDFVEERQVRYGKPFNQISNLASLASGDYGDTIYFVMMNSKEKLQPIFDAVQSRPELEAAYYSDIYSENVWYLEIFSSQATKKNAVIELRKQTGAAVVVGFGDNLNDLPMFEACDVKIAVANAKKAVREAADIVVKSNEDDGVSAYLSSLFINGLI